MKNPGAFAQCYEYIYCYGYIVKRRFINKVLHYLRDNIA